MKTAKDGHYYRDPRNDSYCWKLRVDGRAVIRKAPTKRALMEKVAAALVEVNARGTVMERVDREMTVAGFLTIWLEEFVKPSRAVKTHRQYEQVVCLYTVPSIGTVRLDRLTSVDCQRFLNALSKRGLSPTTVNLARTITKRAFNVARNQVPPLMLANPMDSTERVKAGILKKRVINGDRFGDLVGECLRTKMVASRAGDKYSDLVHRDGPLIAFLLSTGLRVSEANALTWADLADEEANVRRKLTWLAGGRWAFEVPKSARSARRIPLSELARQALTAASSKSDDLDALAWVTERERPFVPRNVQRSLNAILAALGMPHYSLHDLRRSFGTHLARSGTAPHVLQAIMGHESIKTTNDHYLSAFTADMTAAMTLLPSQTK